MKQLVFLFSILVLSCSSVWAQKRNSPRIQEDLSFHAQVYYKSNSATLYVSVNKADLLPKKNTYTEEFKLKFKINYKIESKRKSNSKDTLTKVYEINSSNGEFEVFVDSFEIGPRTEYFDYEVILTDLNKNEFNFLSKSVNPNLSFSPCYFLKRNENGQPIVESYFRDIDVRICSEKYASKGVKIYEFKDSKLAPPPFINRAGGLNTGSPDSVFILHFNAVGQAKLNHNNGAFIISNKERLNEKNQFLVGTAPALFPYFNSYEELIQPLKFFSSRDEFTAINNAEDKRQAFENFWIKIAGSENQAKYLIKKFYQRVKFANKNFTSYKPGWKTDRGLLYIIYGEPAFIDESPNEIKWSYGGKFQSGSSTYTFYQSLGNIENDYELVRNALFKSEWYLAVENWRGGNVYQK